MYLSGHYTATWNGVNIGSTESGFRVHNANHIDRVADDAYGDAMPDFVNQGTDVTVTLTWVDYNSILSALYSFQNATTTTANSFSSNANIAVGVLGSTQAKQLILTPIAGTGNHNVSGVYTFPLAIIASDVEDLLSSKHRKGPVTFTCLPNNTSSGTTGLVYTVSAAS